MSSATDRLLEAAASRTVHHSIILHGPSASQRLELAMKMAMAANCLLGSTGDHCPACERIRKGLHPDVHLLGVADDRKLIAIEQVRAAISEATFRPFEGRTKVFVIDPAEALSVGGANALLKTLEEPASDTLFILLTRSPDLLLPTIRSRSQLVAVAVDERPGRGDSLAALQIDLETATNLAREIVSALDDFATNRSSAALLGIGGRVAEGKPLKDSMGLLVTILRDLAGGRESDLIPREAAARIRGAIDIRKMLQAAEKTLRAMDRLVVNADPRLLIEQALVELQKK